MDQKKLINDFAEKLVNKLSRDEDILKFLEEANDSIYDRSVSFLYIIEAVEEALDIKEDIYRQVKHKLNLAKEFFNKIKTECFVCEENHISKAISELKKIIMMNNKDLIESKAIKEYFNMLNLKGINKHLLELKPYLDEYKENNPSTPIDCSLKFMMEHVEIQLNEANHK